MRRGGGMRGSRDGRGMEFWGLALQCLWRRCDRNVACVLGVGNIMD